MSEDIYLIGSSHFEPRVQERVAEAVNENDFDQVFVEGVDEQTGETVEEYVDKWTEKLSEQIGRTPGDATEDGRFEEAKAVEQSYDGEVLYLDTAKTTFLDAKDTIEGTLRQLASGELTEGPAVLLKEDADQGDFESVMRMYTPDPDLPYQLFTGELDDEEYMERVEEGIVNIFRSKYQEAGRELSEEREEILRRNVREEAPDQQRLREIMVQDVYSGENMQDREEQWLKTFNENYNGEEAAVFVGLAHTDENEDTFYNKLLNEGYSVDRRALRGFESF